MQDLQKDVAEGMAAPVVELDEKKLKNAALTGTAAYGVHEIESGPRDVQEVYAQNI